MKVLRRMNRLSTQGWNRRIVLFCAVNLLLLFLMTVPCSADDPIILDPKERDKTKVQWASLFKHSMTFLAVEHSFRWAKEYYTREATLQGPFIRGYGDALANLHGWSDGDEFLCNYIGHAMQGAVSGYIFSANDPRYNREEIGRNRDYWQGKMRAFAFSALYGLQFEIGPLSEATIGKIQAYWPQQGLVDWAITPSVGLMWTLAEDTLDKYVVKPIEGKVSNKAVRILLRSWLNPARSFANMMAIKVPWHRDSRPGVWAYNPRSQSDSALLSNRRRWQPDPTDTFGRKNALFSFNVPFEFTSFDRLTCVGGGTSVHLPINRSLDTVVHLSGCKLLGLPENVSGDSLTYMAGVRWSPKTASRLIPHARIMIGGHKVYEEKLFPDKKAALLAQGEKGTYYRNVYQDYTQSWHTHGLAVSVGGGVDLGINRIFGLRLASVEYLRSWLGNLNGQTFNQGLRISAGLHMNVGGW